MKMIRLPALAAAALVPALASAGNVTPVAEARPGALVTISGTVERVLDYDEFRLADGTGSILVYVGPDGHDARAGERVTVAGRVDDDGPREIYARSMTREGGATVTFSHRYD